MSRVPWRATATAGVLFGVLFVLCYLGNVWTSLGQQLDNLSLGVGGRVAEGPLGRAAGFWRSELPVVLGAFAVALGVVGLWRRRWRRCLAAGLLALLPLGVGQVVKRLLPRPDLGGYGYPWNTLPSGHTIVASSVILGLLLMLPTAWRRLPVVAAALVFMVLTGYASVLTQAHLTSDVLCGLLLVGGGAVVVRPLADRSAVPPAGRWVWPLVPLAGLASVGCWAGVLFDQGGLALVALAQLLAVTAVAALVLAVLAHLTPVGVGTELGVQPGAGPGLRSAPDPNPDSDPTPHSDTVPSARTAFGVSASQE
jgi:membrane-associated phospholipid phosphatase